MKVALAEAIGWKLDNDHWITHCGDVLFPYEWNPYENSQDADWLQRIILRQDSEVISFRCTRSRNQCECVIFKKVNGILSTPQASEPTMPAAITTAVLRHKGLLEG
jgi:hypothetical protein